MENIEIDDIYRSNHTINRVTSRWLCGAVCAARRPLMRVGEGMV